MLEGRLALITGGAQGIGRAIAIALANEGARVVTNNRRRGSTTPFTFGKEFEKSLSPEQKKCVRQKDAVKRGDAGGQDQ